MRVGSTYKSRFITDAKVCKLVKGGLVTGFAIVAETPEYEEWNYEKGQFEVKLGVLRPVVNKKFLSAIEAQAHLDYLRTATQFEEI